MSASPQEPPRSKDALAERRAFLGLAIAVLLGDTLRWLAKGSAISLTPSAALLAPLGIESAAAIGEIVRLTLPEMDDRENVITQLLTAMRLSHHSVVNASRVEMSNRINAAVRLDFESGRIVNVVGWRLSVTEALLCALAAEHVS